MLQQCCIIWLAIGPNVPESDSELGSRRQLVELALESNQLRLGALATRDVATWHSSERDIEISFSSHSLSPS